MDHQQGLGGASAAEPDVGNGSAGDGEEDDSKAGIGGGAGTADDLDMLRGMGNEPPPSDVVAVLCRNPSAEVAHTALKMLGTMVHNDAGVTAVLAADGALDAAVAALKAHAGDATVQQHGLYLLAKLARQGRQLVVSADGAILAVAALHAHTGDAKVQENGLCLLAQMSCSTEGAVAVFAIECTAANVMSSLREHPTNAGVQKWGMCFGWSLTSPSRSYNRNRAAALRVLEAGGMVDLAVAALRLDTGAAQGHTYALRMLKNLVNPRTTSATVGAIADVMAALRTHADDDQVQEDGMGFLASLQGTGAAELIALGEVPTFYADASDAAVRHRSTVQQQLRQAVTQHATMIHSLVRQLPTPTARRYALALVYSGSNQSAKANFTVGSAGLRQLQFMLADEERDVRLAGAHAVNHLLVKQLRVNLEQPAPPGAGASSGNVHDFSALFGMEEDSDVCFEIDGSTLYAHRVVLKGSMCTDYFRHSLSHNTADSLRVPVMVDDNVRGFEVFRLLIKYLYTGALEEVEPQMLLDLFRAARFKMVGPLAALCAKRLAAGLTVERWEGLKEVLDLLDWHAGLAVPEAAVQQAADALGAAVGRFMLQNLVALVVHELFEERRVVLAARLLGNDYSSAVL
jgi:hypothetical protein